MNAVSRKMILEGSVPGGYAWAEFALFFNLPRVERVSVCGCHVFFEVGHLRLVDLRVWSEIQRIPTSEN